MFGQTSSVPFLAPGTPMILRILPRSSFACLLILLTISHGKSDARAETLNVSLRHQQAVDDTQGDYRIESTSQIWQPTQTAVIVCDMWDSHHCYRAVLREQQMVPRMEGLLNNLRSRGVTIIHAPSSCVGAYADNPARRRVASIPKSESPAGINQWCRSIPSEEAVTYPLDQSDGGEDDTPEEHASWAATLKSKGLNPKAPWKKQHAGLTIDPEQDFISDRGDEVWSILKHRNIANVILVGVHTNMCVLGRPFGLRQLSKNGMNVVLMRDLTDSMYNPRSWPHVSHLEGNALIIAHIERHICPTMTSDQFIGGIPFKFTPIQSSR
jgi:nicotinamidase-related amidase